MIIRRMTKEDIPAVVKMEQELFGTPWTYSALEENLNRPVYQNWIAECCTKEDEKTGPAGFLCMMSAAGEGELLRIGVKKDAQRHGIAAGLMEQMIEAANEQKLEFIMLEVRKSNFPAIRLYQKYGFTLCGFRKHYYQNPTEDAAVMKKEMNVHQ